MIRLGRLLYRFRGWTPVPLVLAYLLLAEPTLRSILLGVAVLLAGELLRIHGLRYLAPTARGGRYGAERLATGGPFRFIRNPLYLGNVLLVAGLCLAGGIDHPGFLILTAAALALQYGSIIIAEEAFLASRFPVEFSRYRAWVPRLLPRRPPYPERTPPCRTLRSVVRAEFRTLHTLALLLLLIGVKAAAVAGA
jgi:protein-S-isoprenylcysteine O-methyltransferase Ste14